ncbi:MAG: class IV adenylate cyclase [Elusimicrobiota bacterium]
MLEVEIKFTAPDFAVLEERLKQARAEESEPEHDEEDTYFNAPDRDFSKTDEALRMRCTGEASLVTYKGPKVDAKTKTRAEIDVALASGEEPAENFARLLLRLGYKPAGVVRKTRKAFRLESGGLPVTVCLDTVQELGRFAELEIKVPESQLETARNTILDLAGKWGLKDSERRSYLELLLSKEASSSK